MEEPIRELCCHYLVTCVCNNNSYNLGSDHEDCSYNLGSGHEDCSYNLGCDHEDCIT